MTTFDSTKTSLGKLLEQVIEGKIQLPDFQRGWVWDDSHIRSLLVSLGRSFPIGSVMLLEAGGAARFQVRFVEGVDLLAGTVAENLILDGQQRLTSLTQVLKLTRPVRTKDDKGRDVQRLYYIDIEKALESNAKLDEAIFAVDETRTLRTNFGRDVVLDLTTSDAEYAEFCFPCNQILNSDKWEEGLFKHDPTKFSRYIEFRKQVLNAFREYDLPVIQLKKETSKEAVCLVFEKVNTGGVPLSVFELATAAYAADGFNLRADWYGIPNSAEVGRKHKFGHQPLLKDLQPTEFLQGLTLLHTYERHSADIKAGRSGKEVTAVSAKREHVLALPLDAYKSFADKLTEGFFFADNFLRWEGFYRPEFLPYRSQIIPLAAAMVYLGERWLEPEIKQKISRWYWSGVLGELYGGATETRIALDLQNILEWTIEKGATEPVTVAAAGFQPSRLDTLRTRTSAAYRGIYVLLQRQGGKDFYWKVRMIDIDREEIKIDIHHIFPKAWCKNHSIPQSVYDSIVNKTPISYKANRIIGGKAPSKYLLDLQNDPKVQTSESEQDEILKSHLISPTLLRKDDFEDFYKSRKTALLELISHAMGKPVLQSGGEAPPEDIPDDEDEQSENLS